MKIKICGITNLRDALLCEQSGADMLGFVFYCKSKRHIDFDSARNIIGKLSSGTIKVGVFVNESAETINKTVEKLKLNFVQLHGDEPPEFLGKISCRSIKSFRITKSFDYSILEAYKGSIPLLDTFSSELYGGTGRTFDWELIPVDKRNKIILAGGISASNIRHVIRTVRPYAVDISSSLEFEPGRKDQYRVREFFYVLKSMRIQI